ncbi:MAG: adenosylcobinamide-GDP ribazoletransferase [Bacillota bacterium]
MRLAFTFLTTFPLPDVKKIKENDLAKGLRYAPLIGLFIGTIMLYVWALASFLQIRFVASLLVVLAYVLISGGLHLDGMADTCDGVFSNRSRERVLEIMRDSHIGTNGVIGLVFVILFYWVSIANLPFFFAQNAVIPLLLMPVAGRIGSVVASGMSRYARETEGLGKNFVEQLTIVDAAIGAASGLVIFLLVGGLKGLILFVLVILSTSIAILFFKRRLGGVTGDTLGAICEFNQVVFLFGSLILINIWK